MNQTENNKVVIPKEVAVAIEDLSIGRNNADELLLDFQAIKEYAENPSNKNSKIIFKYICEVGKRKYFTAIINGYEVEVTPEDKVKQIFDYPIYPNAVYKDVYRNGICDCLKALGIKIEGVNK